MGDHRIDEQNEQKLKIEDHMPVQRKRNKRKNVILLVYLTYSINKFFLI